MELDPGGYQYAFAFTMGFAYQCDAAIDDIQVIPCPTQTGAIHITETEKYTYLSSKFRTVVKKWGMYTPILWCHSRVP